MTPLTGPLAHVRRAWTRSASTSGRRPSRTASQCGDGKTHPITIIVKDSQSESGTRRDGRRRPDHQRRRRHHDGRLDARHGEPGGHDRRVVRRALRLQRLPVAAVLLRPSKDPANAVPFKWTYHFFWGLRGRRLPSSPACGTSCRPTSSSARCGRTTPTARAGPTPRRASRRCSRTAGYTFVDGGRFLPGTQDYTSQITKFKAAGCEILSGVFIPPDFVNFWKQSYQQGFQPVAATVGKALLFPDELAAIGPIGYGLTTECWWSPSHPFTSSLTGRDLPAARRRLDEAHRQAVGAAAAALRRLRGRRRRPQAHRRTSTTSSRSSTPSPTPTSRPSPGTSRGRPARR